jgi:hypothetical protein
MNTTNKNAEVGESFPVGRSKAKRIIEKFVGG